MTFPRCWNDDPYERPNFESLYRSIERMSYNNQENDGREIGNNAGGAAAVVGGAALLGLAILGGLAAANN